MKLNVLPQPIVYFVRGKLTNRIKIGKTCTLIEQRLRQLQTGSPDELEFLGAYFGSELNEFLIHEMFKSSCLHGEWFESSDMLMEFISQKCIHESYAVYCAVADIDKGLLTYDQAMRLGTSGLKKRAQQHLVQAYMSAF